MKEMWKKSGEMSPIQHERAGRKEALWCMIKEKKNQLNLAEVSWNYIAKMVAILLLAIVRNETVEAEEGGQKKTEKEITTMIKQNDDKNKKKERNQMLILR